MSNPFHDSLTAAGQPINAQALLNIFRPQVEQCLQRHECLQPPSQSARAVALLRRLYRVDAPPTPWSDAERAAFRQLNADRYLLEDFLSVHRTCWILEARAI